MKFESEIRLSFPVKKYFGMELALAFLPLNFP
jgi:hypothetical protein